MKKNKLIIIGGSAGAKIVYNIAKRDFEEIFFFDSFWGGAPSKINEPQFKNLMISDLCEYFIATGDDVLREAITNNIKIQYQRMPCNVIHPASTIESDEIGYGNLILAGAFIGYDAKIGNGCIINTNSVCEHDSEIGDFSQIAPSATILGRVKIGSRVFVGANSTVLPNLCVCDDVVIGAGCAIVKNIECKGVYTGIPGKLRGR